MPPKCPQMDTQESPPVRAPHDEWAMGLALEQASKARDAGEVPVGAVIIRPSSGPNSVPEVLAVAHNQPISRHDPTAHAEVVALRSAAMQVQNYRLPGCELFVTLEPCAMCAMALMHARVARVVFGAYDPKTGASGSVVNLFANATLNHHTRCVGGFEAERSADLLRSFFLQRRAMARLSRSE